MDELVCRTKTRVRFSDVDSMGVVWHGNYIKYFEDGREAFGILHGINYMDFHSRGVLIPLVKVTCDFKRPLKYGDYAVIETRFVNCEAAKLQYDYTIFRNETDEVVATGSSIQVFLNLEMELLLDFPPFYHEWKKKHNLA
ncbi:MAG TPA: acyl-CoA thioesterase [Bacteroidales bacterium]|nr:acyl-CoA thioesterase [Bacteroidales bacterium]